MRTPFRQQFAERKSRPSRDGFALVATVLMLVLLSILAVGLLGLSTTVVRSSASDNHRQQAEANARLALMQAIGQLQRELGPDQRVSAPASILPYSSQPHWTGVWKTRRDDNSSFWSRDPDSGSWIDARDEEDLDIKDLVKTWLVSGESSPISATSDNLITLVGGGSLSKNQSSDRVEAPAITISENQQVTGRLAWWTGDLGTKANIATTDPFHESDGSSGSPEENSFRFLTAQHSEPAVMGQGLELDEEQRSRLASNNTLDLINKEAREWTREHFHDFTTYSKGLLTDVQEGGLKKDLTAFLQSNGTVPDQADSKGLDDKMPLLANAETSRHQAIGPRFGLLRNWAQATAPLSGKDVATTLPETDPSRGGQSEALALCNANPTRLADLTRGNLQPILVEGSMMNQLSVYEDRRSAGAPPVFQMRYHLYPRVVLWNPYNVELEMDRAIVMIQGNGRQEIWTDNMRYDSDGNETGVISQSQWLFFEGGRSTEFRNGNILQSEGYQDPYMGSYYFSIPKTTFGPGDCLVFSAARSDEYDGLSTYNPGAYDLANNELSCEVVPDPSRSYYVSASELGGGISYRPIAFWYQSTPAWSSGGRNGIENQSDDTRVVMKALPGSSAVTFESFDELPQLAYLSGSIQYGAGREPRTSWNVVNKMKIELLKKERPEPTVEPNVRTRDGLRLRWFEEHPSNLLNSGALNDSPSYFEEALLANWNPRAAYSVRSPWENIGGTLANSGSGGGPWFFGAYTRDLYDEAVGWAEQQPAFEDGRYRGNPFGQPQEGPTRHVLFELPRKETGVLSLGQFQHAKLSEFIWHPSFAVGNSLIDPRLSQENRNRTIPPNSGAAEDGVGGFHRNVIGWSRDFERSRGRDEWASTGISLLQELPSDDHLVYDLSYEVNQALFDRYFLSSGTPRDKEYFLQNPPKNPLPNGRIRLANWAPAAATAESLTDFHRAASQLIVDGAFNVNSTSVEAWKALLSATRSTQKDESTPFARVLTPAEGVFRAGDDANGASAWAGNRHLTDEEIEILAQEIVVEVKERGPFLSLADFVNRRLSRDQTSLAGTLQAAINRSPINENFEDEFPLDNDTTLGDYRHPDFIRDATRLEQSFKPKTKAWGAPGFLTQGDILQVLAPMLSARSDSFVIRAYGEATDSVGRPLAKAWCEATVQRTTAPIHADETGLNPASNEGEPDFGRRFEVISFRWLKPSEV